MNATRVETGTRRTNGKLRWSRFRLRTLFMLVTVIGIATAWVIVPARRQQASVHALERLGCTVVYEHERRLNASGAEIEWHAFCFGPKDTWFHLQLASRTWRESPWAVDYFHNATSIRLDFSDVRAATPLMKQLPRLQEIFLPNPGGTCGTGAEKAWAAVQNEIDLLREELPHVKITYYTLAIIG
jgi:hypothetical protein